MSYVVVPVQEVQTLYPYKIHLQYQSYAEKTDSLKIFKNFFGGDKNNVELHELERDDL